ncbi:MAG: trifunctional serine/threonine-protein kinase/ATP-binding protein/sensor histidine kinase [Calothrix sp. MO_192.B10]|nr:trifunctional serine/threonine-protein kinase/ATP-binding protein/sensor histidine kinase [Calothrix sp. MO_192.B10]
MLMIPGFSFTEQIHTSRNTYIYRGIKDKQPVILKILKDEFPSIEAIARLKHEYSIVQGLDNPWIVKALNLENHEKRLVLVFEDFDGISLKQYLKSTKPSVSLTLEIAKAVTKALIYIHSQNIIHKDIKPANIIINPDNGEIKITDFSIASRLSKEIVSNNPNQLEGTLAYLSPEQTGRMNRTLDYRSDFYSLGVTLYELLTGVLPFQSQDVMELVHSHIAKTPTSIQELNPQIPDIWVGIINKLMAKNAEDRYQSAKGLLVDLEQLANGNSDFVPGALDLQSQLLIPQKLYGREEQVKSLLDAFEQVAGGETQLMLVSGYSGIGKTSVINEVNKPITARKGYFISGKFDQFKRDIPYASLIQAFESLIQQLLTETLTQIEVWKEKIQAAVGSNGQVIIDVIPSLELIIGKQPEVSELPPTESQNRFNRVFQEFMQIFATQEHPLVIFLDDLQWADSATLQLMQLLVTDAQIKHLLLIGAYRDNEVSATHPLMATIEEIEKAGTCVSNIVLRPLHEDNVRQLSAETLNDNHNRSDELAKLIFNKTGGNPFFITQLLQALYQDSLLTFDFSQQLWQWDIQEINVIGITDKSVVELVANRIQKLPASTQDMLKLAACIGDKFTLDVLSTVSEKSAFDAANDLNTAVQAGLILPLTEAYRIPLLFQDQESGFDSQKIGYKFLHDRVQQASYSLIPQDEKQETHIYIGRLLKELTPEEDLDNNILNIVNQLNYGVDLLNKEQDKYELAYLNRIAGNKAKKNSAFNTALKYFNLSMSLLDSSNWQTNYNFVLGLYLETAEAEYLNGNFNTAEKLANIVIGKASSILDQAKAYEIIMQLYIAQNMMLEALNFGIKILHDFGISLPKKPTLVNVFAAIAKTKLALAGKRIEDLVKLPEMTDPHKLAVLRIFMIMIPAASQAGSLLFPLTVLAIVRLSIKYGNSPATAFGYTIYGAILCDKFGDVESGYRFGCLGQELLDKMDANFLKCKINFIFNGAIKHFKNPVNKTILPLTRAMQTGLETGDVEYVGYNAWVVSENLFLNGTNLDLVENKLSNYIKQLNQLNLSDNALAISVFLQKTLNLQGKSSHRVDLIGNAFNERQDKQILSKSSTILGGLYASKTVLAYLFNDYAQAINNGLLTEKIHENNPGFLPYSVNNFYHSLALLAQYPKATHPERKQYLKQVATNQKKMKLWADHAPCNYQNKYDLVEAEKARILGKNTIAAKLYDQAIAGAKTNNYIQEVALANELAAKFYLASGQTNFAKTYMTDAYYDYIKWGAYAKVQDLEKRYPNLIICNTVQPSEIGANTTISTSISISTTGKTTSVSQNLDLASVMKASEAIQSSMQMETLPHRLLSIIIENAAAQKGCMLLEKNNSFQIEAIEHANGDDTIALQSIPFEKSDILPHSAINYVSRTQKPLLVRDANKDSITKNDPYVKQHKCKSILCLPIQYQGKLIGIFYLENNLVTSAFTPKHLELVKILATQAAISITNAQLFSREKQKSQELRNSLEQLEITQGQLVEKAQDLEEALMKLQNTQSQLVHTEKISALGQLVAGVAHEVNNPVSFISSNLFHAEQYVSDLVNHLNLYQEKYGDEEDEEIVEDAETIDLEYLLDDLPQMLKSMKLGTVRIKDIMQSLRNFSRNDGAQKRTVDITEGIDSTILILGHRLKAKPERPAIKIIKEYDTNLPQIECYPGQLNQVFMNLLANGIDALDESNEGKTYQEIEENPNTITIRTTTEGDWVQISIKDNGPGMSEETRQKLFDAFFTTKPEGKGTGLGLSISYQIVTENHGGTLDCISKPGEGAEFVISIPVK